MIKCIIFDFDGTLCPLKEVHYNALNNAINSVVGECAKISIEEHIIKYDGLSTKAKLNELVKQNKIRTDQIEKINTIKQQLTIDIINTYIKTNKRLIQLLYTLRSEGYATFIASNAIYPTIQAGLQALGIYNLFDGIYANTDCLKQKPHPNIFLRVMADSGFAPDETLIIEDSKYGREAALRSHAHLCAVDSEQDTTYEHIKKAINKANKPLTIKWHDKGINIIVPAAGMGSRFIQKGYKLPKPLIDVAGKPMIQRVIENMPIDGRFIFVVQKAHFENYYLGTLLNSIAPGCEIITVDGMTDGAARTCLLAKQFIDNNEHLIIANSDQFVQWDPCSFMWSMIGNNECDGQILTFKDTNPKWSFAKIDSGWVSEVAEKKVISDNATVGIYAFKKGNEFVKYAEQMINKNIRTNGEFYVCPVFNEFIGDGKKIKTFGCDGMYGMGTPEDLEATIKSKIFE